MTLLSCECHPCRTNGLKVFIDLDPEFVTLVMRVIVAVPALQCAMRKEEKKSNYWETYEVSETNIVLKRDFDTIWCELVREMCNVARCTQGLSRMIKLRLKLESENNI
jgi:hypothetical protein